MILAIDCAHQNCSVALTDQGKVIHELSLEMERGQAENLIDMVSKVMENHSFNELDCIAVSTGPGSFTGVRIGLATANGLAMTAHKPMVGVSLLDLIASQNPNGKIGVVLETKREDYYVQLFENGKPINDGVVALADDLKKYTDFTFIGNGTDRLSTETDLKTKNIPMPTATDIALYAEHQTPCFSNPPPLYLRPADVTVK